MLKVRLEGEAHSAGRGVGFYRTHLQEALSETGKVSFVTDSPDIVHFPFFDLFYPTLPQKLEKPTVVTIHDLTPLVLPELYPMGIRAKAGLALQRLALRQVNAILTDSLSSKKDIVDIFHIDPEKVFVTYLAADPAYRIKPTPNLIKETATKYGLPKQFILYVGGINPNKNLVALAKTALKLNVPLVLVGSEFTKPLVETFSLKKLLGLQPVHPEVLEFNRLKEVIDNSPLFYRLGFVPTEDLNAIYRLAAVYCQPSLYEGFGLPLLEAMTAGCPIVSSTSGSLPEIYPLESFVFSPNDRTGMEQAISKVLSLPPKARQTMIKIGQEKASQFSWQKTATETLSVYSAIRK